MAGTRGDAFTTLLCLLAALHFEEMLTASAVVIGEEITTVVPSVPLPALAQFPPSVGGQCFRDSRTYVAELRNSTLWAAQMFDSWGKLPTGVLYGSTYEMGNFDQCIEVAKSSDPMTSDNRTIRGKYCLARVEIRPREPLAPDSLWSRVQEAEADPSAKSRTLLHWAVCVPDSCSAVDVQDHLTMALRPLSTALGGGERYGESTPSYTVQVETSMCFSKLEVEEQNSTISRGEIAICSIFGTCVLIVLVATIFDIITSRNRKDRDVPAQKRGLGTRILMCFSASTNSSKLFHSSEDDADPFAFINGMKVWTMLLVIFGHRFIFNTAYPILNTQFVESLYRRADMLSLMGSTVIVDTFLVITGSLLVYLYLTDIQKHPNTCPIIYVYIHRFIRLTPIYMLVVAFYSTIFVRIGDGPLWKSVVGTEASYCAENWWTNLLYINTYVNPERMCMIQSWYMAVDMHLFIIGVPIAHLLFKRPTLGRMLLALTTILSILVPFLVILLRQLDPILLIYFKNLENLRIDQNFQESYTQTHMRAIPYFVGMVSGSLIFEARKRGYKFKTHMEKQTALVLASASGFSAILGSVVFLHPDREYSALEAAFFGSLHHLVWSLCMATLIFAEATGCYRFYHKFLSWKALVPFSRLTYGAFLVHAGIQIYSVNTRRSPETATTFKLMGEVLFDAFCSYLLAYILSMLFEAPWLKLEKLLIESVTPSRPENTSGLNKTSVRELQSHSSRDCCSSPGGGDGWNNMAGNGEMTNSFHEIG